MPLGKENLMKISRDIVESIQNNQNQNSIESEKLYSATDFTEIRNYDNIELLYECIGNDDIRIINKILAIIGVAEQSPGTTRIYIRPNRIINASNNLHALDNAINALQQKLNNDNRNLPRQEVVNTISEYLENPDNIYSTVVQIMSYCEIAIPGSRGRRGGIVLYNAEQQQKQIQEEYEEANRNHASSDNNREKVLYGIASKKLAEWGYEPIQLGEVRRLEGEWNTPDVIGYKLNKRNLFLGFDVEVITVEVKWSISKSAIAQAESHQRLGHNAYLMVYENYDSISDEFKKLCAEKGIGVLCCDTEDASLRLESRDNNTPFQHIERFLNKAIPEEDHKRQLRKEMVDLMSHDVRNIMSSFQ